MEQPIALASRTDGTEPSRSAETASRSSCFFAADASFQLSSMRPLYSSFRAEPNTKQCGVQRAPNALAVSCVSSHAYGNGKAFSRARSAIFSKPSSG